MKKLIILLFLIPFALYGQKTNVRAVVTGTDAMMLRGPDSLNPYIPHAYRSALTITTGIGITQQEIIDNLGLNAIPTNIYYVNNSGDDTNSGLTPAMAWAHHPWMSTWTGAVTLVAGDMVCMKRGDTWTIATPASAYITVAQDGSAGNYIVTTAYGVGAKPIINISTNTNYPVILVQGHAFVTFDNLTITHYALTRAYSDRNGIQIEMDGVTYPHDIKITNCTIYNIPCIGINLVDDGYNITVGDITATTTATITNFSNEIYNCGYGGIILFGLNVATSRSDYNVYYNYVHDIDPAATVTEDAYCIYFGTLNVNGYPRYCTARFNYVHDNTFGKGLDIHGGEYISILDNYVNDCRVGIDIQAADRVDRPTAILDNCHVERNIIEQPGDHPATYYMFIEVCAENTALRATNNYVRDNSCFYTTSPASDGTACGIYVWNIDGVTIEGNEIYNGPVAATTGGIVVGWDETKYVKNVIVNNNFIKDWTPSIYTNVAIDGDVTYTNNICSSQGVPFQAYTLDVSAGNMTLYNNVFQSSSAVCLVDLHWGPSVFDVGTSLVIKNNIICFATSLSEIYIYTPTTMNGTLTIDNNLYYNSSYATPFSLAAAEHNFADWQGHGYDVSGVNASNPLFKNTSTTYSEEDDFILQNTSPCINAGVDVLIDYQGIAPDIGAKEKR